MGRKTPNRKGLPKITRSSVRKSRKVKLSLKQRTKSAARNAGSKEESGKIHPIKIRRFHEVEKPKPLPISNSTLDKLSSIYDSPSAMTRVQYMEAHNSEAPEIVRDHQVRITQF